MRPPGKLIWPGWFFRCDARWVKQHLQSSGTLDQRHQHCGARGLRREELSQPVHLLDRELRGVWKLRVAARHRVPQQARDPLAQRRGLR